MPKITFMGAGSSVFAKNVLGDCMLTPALQDSDIALYDIDGKRLRESQLMLETLNKNTNKARARIRSYLGMKNRRAALKGADYVVNAVQVGGYKPCTVTDFEIPKKYGLRQTIADTLGIGGIFRALRTIPVMLDFARDMEDVCPDAWMLNYTNPMAMLSQAMLRGSNINYVGLCHSVQGCAYSILLETGLWEMVEDLQWKVAGINHQAWLLEVADGGIDLYPEIKKRAAEMIEKAWRKGGKPYPNILRHYLMLHFGYYITESSEHNAEYMPYFIKSQYPELIEKFAIPLDEYPRRCVAQIKGWQKRSKELVRNPNLGHTRSHEYGSYIMEAMETDVPFRFGGNVLNSGLITNLPEKAVVEVTCLADRTGVQPVHVGDLPEQCAAMNRTNVNPQILAVEAALTKRKDYVYQAAMMDPHTAAEIPIDKIRSLCDELIKAHGKYLPKYTETKPVSAWKGGKNGQFRSDFFENWRISAPQPAKGPLEDVEYPTKTRLGWKRIAAEGRGFINMHGMPKHQKGYVFFKTKARAPKAGTWNLLLGHDGGAKVFIDGACALCEPERANPAKPTRSSASVKLSKGDHEILVAFDPDEGRGWGFFFRFEVPANKRSARGTPTLPKEVTR